jgi:hypothetical protein
VRGPTDADGDPIPPGWSVTDALARHATGLASGIIELRRDDLAYRGGVDLLRATLTFGGAGLGFFLVAALVVFAVYARSLSNELAEVDADIDELLTTALPDVDRSSLKTSAQRMSVMRGKAEDSKARATMLGGVGGPPPTIDMLDRFWNTVEPEDGIGREITVTPTTVNFEAEVPDYAGVAKVEEALQGADVFKQATKGSETKRGSKVVFDVTIPIGEQADGGEG